MIQTSALKARSRMMVATPAGAKGAVGAAPSSPVPPYRRNAPMAKRGLAQRSVTIALAWPVSGSAARSNARQNQRVPREKPATTAAIVARVLEDSGCVPTFSARLTRENALPEAQKRRMTAAIRACVMTNCGLAPRRPVKPRGAADYSVPRALLTNIVIMKPPTCVGRRMLWELVDSPQRSATLRSSLCVDVMGATTPMLARRIATEQVWQVLVSAQFRSESRRAQRS
jgi:hypothetical protein